MPMTLVLLEQTVNAYLIDDHDVVADGGLHLDDSDVAAFVLLAVFNGGVAGGQSAAADDDALALGHAVAVDFFDVDNFFNAGNRWHNGLGTGSDEYLVGTCKSGIIDMHFGIQHDLDAKLF